ncbi:MAG: hypothetical protein UV98_C0040G0003 [Parcubacteria group bacterium GW2011_GWB1_43_6]|nr:MAG: hypothetical protein UV98_C0040G0003 [Parcubacteria group bacterium GW2011_GWB1_43_6]
MPNKQEGIPSELILDYMGRNKLPEVTKDISSFPKDGWAIEYKNSGVAHHADIRGLMITPEDPPVAVSYLGTGEEEVRDE